MNETYLDQTPTTTPRTPPSRRPGRRPSPTSAGPGCSSRTALPRPGSWDFLRNRGAGRRPVRLGCGSCGSWSWAPASAASSSPRRCRPRWAPTPRSCWSTRPRASSSASPSSTSCSAASSADHVLHRLRRPRPARRPVRRRPRSARSTPWPGGSRPTPATFEADVLVVALGADLHPDATPGPGRGAATSSTPSPAPSRPATCSRLPRRPTSWSRVTSTPFKCPPAPERDRPAGPRPPARTRPARPLDGVPGDAARACRSRRRPTASAACWRSSRERGIAWHPGELVRSLDPAAGRPCSATARELPFDLFLGVPTHRAPAVVVESGLTVDGWIPVDPLTLETRFEDVYAVGDVTSVGTPKAGVFAEGQAAVVAAQLIARGRGEASRHDVRRPRHLLPGVRRRPGRQGRRHLPQRPGAGRTLAGSVTGARRRQGRLRRRAGTPLVRPRVDAARLSLSEGRWCGTGPGRTAAGRVVVAVVVVTRSSDPADHDVVVAGLVDGVDRAVDVREAPSSIGEPVAARRGPLHVGELVGAPAGHRVGQLGLVGGEEVDAELAGRAGSAARRARSWPGRTAPAAGPARRSRTTGRSCPTGSPLLIAVTTVTPEAKRPSTSRKRRGRARPPRGRRGRRLSSPGRNSKSISWSPSQELISSGLGQVSRASGLIPSGIPSTGSGVRASWRPG